MRSFLTAVVTILIIGSAYAQGGVIVDDFDHDSFSSWAPLQEPDKTVLSSESGLSGFGLGIAIPSYGFWYADAYKNDICLVLPQPMEEYNLSFWYYRSSVNGVCVDSSEFGGLYMEVFVSKQDFDFPDGNWSVTGSHLADESCDRWIHFNRAFDESDYVADSIDLSSDRYIGSLIVEYLGNASKLIVDDFRIIPRYSETTSCDEYWSCSDWGKCHGNGTKYRTCVDLSSCGTSDFKPVESKGCTCEPDWSCGSWGLCVLGNQGRACSDANGCGTSEGIPDQYLPCLLWEPVAALGLVVAGGVLKFRKPGKGAARKGKSSGGKKALK